MSLKETSFEPAGSIKKMVSWCGKKARSESKLEETCMGINHEGAVVNEYRSKKRENPRHDMYTFSTPERVFKYEAYP